MRIKKKLLLFIAVFMMCTIFSVFSEGHPMPKSIQEANADFERRKTDIVKSWIKQYESIGREFKDKEEKDDGTYEYLYDWTTNGNVKRALTIFSAGFEVLSNPGDYSKEELSTLSGLDISASYNKHLEEFQKNVLDFCKTAQQYETVGTDGIKDFLDQKDKDLYWKGYTGHKHGGDYDFTLLPMISFIYKFKDRPDLLTEEMIWELLSHNKSGDTDDGGVVLSGDTVKGIIPVSGVDTDDYISFRSRRIDSKLKKNITSKFSIVETENHLLGIYIWRYLLHNYLEWVAGQPSNGNEFTEKLKKVYNSNPDHYTNNDEMNDFILQLMGRIPYNGLFEDNAKAYESISLHAILVLYSYANVLFPERKSCQKIKTAARNALDYLSAKYAFQSFEGKRYTPMRRNWDYKGRLQFYANDYTHNIFGILSGGYVYDDTIDDYPEINNNRYILHVKSLKVVNQQEPSALTDNVRINVTVDDVGYRKIEKEIEEGDNEKFDLKYWFKNKVKIRLWEVDDNGPNEDIGTYEFYPNTVPSEGYIKYEMSDYASDAKYELYYKIEKDSYYYAPYSYKNMSPSGPGYYALWTSILDYRIPPAIHDFILNKYDGYWARLQSRYTKDHYQTKITAEVSGTPSNPGHVYPRYFKDNGDIYNEGEFSPVTQLFFVTNDYANVAGGMFRKYCSDQVSADGFSKTISKLRSYWTIAKPYTIIPKGNDVNFPQSHMVEQFEQKLPTMRGQLYDIHYSENLDTYKSFSYGYGTEGDNDHHKEWAVSYPKTWEDKIVSTFSIGRADFKIFDFTKDKSHPLYNTYLVVAKISKQPDNAQWENYSRGFWEIVPAHRFSSYSKLVTYIKEKHTADRNFPDWSKRHYVYRMTTGEQIMLHDKSGSSKTNRGIIGIYDEYGTEIPLSDYFLDNNDLGKLEDLPLMSVWEVDRDYNFTGTKYAWAEGDGRITIYNPHIGSTIEIDSSDYKNPKRTETYPDKDMYKEYLSDMDWIDDAENGYGPVEKDTSNGSDEAYDGNTIKIRGRKFQKGLGVHSDSKIEYQLNGQYEAFVSYIGIDDEVSHSDRPSVTFEVWLDDEKFYDSGLLTSESSIKKIVIPVKGVDKLTLIVTDGDGDRGYDHADWADAHLLRDTVYISDLEFADEYNGYGPIERDQTNNSDDANDGYPIQLDGVFYEKGLGVHASSDIEIDLTDLDLEYDMFISDIFVDPRKDGTVVFKVYSDDEKIFDSGLMTRSSGKKSIALDISYTKKLKLHVSRNGDGYYDHAVWAGARLTRSIDYISDLGWFEIENGYGPVEKDKSNGSDGFEDGNVLTLYGKSYMKGLGVHSKSVVAVGLNNEYRRFKAEVGIDDEVGKKGSAVFKVYGDSTSDADCLYNSGILTGDHTIRNIAIDVSDVITLILVVEDAGDGKYYDHASWANARLIKKHPEPSLDPDDIYIERYPDLVIKDFSYSPEDPEPGDEITFTVSVQNIGDRPLQSYHDKVEMNIFIDDKRLGLGGYAGDIDPGQTVEFKLRSDWGSPATKWISERGVFTATAIINHRGRVEEARLDNNRETVYLTVKGESDLYIDRIIAKPGFNVWEGDNVELSVEVTNRGKDLAEGFLNQVQFKLYIDGQYFGIGGIDHELAPGETQILPIRTDWGAPEALWAAVKGTHYVKAVVDPYDMIKESEELNNERTVLIKVKEYEEDINIIQISQDQVRAVLNTNEAITYATLRYKAGNGSLKSAVMTKINGIWQTTIDYVRSDTTFRCYIMYKKPDNTTMRSPWKMRLGTANSIALKSMANGKYVSADNYGNSPLIANQSTSMARDYFSLIENSDGTYSLRANVNGKYVCADDWGNAPLIANRSSINEWEKFELIINTDGSFSFKSIVSGKYVCADNDGNSPLIANRTSISSWEKFVLFFY